MALMHSVKNLARAVTPPVVADLLRKHVTQRHMKLLFRGESAMFSAFAQKSTCYGEYGCGASTIWVAENTRQPILSVDSSKFWIDTVLSQVGERDELSVNHVDLGELADWGRPVNYEKRANIRDYTEGLWGRAIKPDLILIDGRFRVACFLASLLNARPGAVILFDDYADREHYHLIEEFVSIAKSSGQQAAFVVPEDLPVAQIREEYERFIYVFD